MMGRRGIARGGYHYIVVMIERERAADEDEDEDFRLFYFLWRVCVWLDAEGLNGTEWGVVGD